jgi:hypothetical protein
MEAEEQVYHKQYYEDNKKTISELRKIKYHTDREHRERVKAKARKNYRKNLKPKDPDNKIGYTVKVIDGVSLYSMKYALNIIKKSRDFLLSWELTGHIPKSTYTDSRGWRLYTEYQISLLDMAIDKYDEKKWNKEQVRQFLTNNWKE